LVFDVHTSFQGIPQMSADPKIPFQQRDGPSGFLALRRRFLRLSIFLILVFILGVIAWTWITLHFSYSTGERVGYIQKISKKGWVCKTWEGELAMLNQPGVPPPIFNFSVRDETVAQNILEYAGRRVHIVYEQHRGVPSSCFGETEYFVTGVRPGD
jgi:hypothetical protein